MSNGQILPEAITFTDPLACVVHPVAWAARNSRETVFEEIGSLASQRSIMDYNATSRASAFYFHAMRVYLANHDVRAALTSLECGACTDWTR
jgi:hypothetical protein